VFDSSLELLGPWLWALVGPWVLVLALTPLVAAFARRYGALDLPQGRKLHRVPVPLLGGVAVFGAAGLALAVGAPFSPPIRGGLFGPASLAALGVGAAAMVALGTWDDLRDLSALQKLIGQLAIAALTWWLGFRCGEVELWGGWVLSDATPISFAITVAWIVAITNAFNLLDGIDGLTAGIGIAAALVIFTLASHHGATVPVIASLALAGALSGFLRFNLPPARIFLGDGGALAIGYVIAVTSLASAQKGPTAVVLIIPFVAVGIPLIDTIVAVLRRLRVHLRARRLGALRPLALWRAIASADRGHIHHLLLRSGWSVRRILFVLYALSALLGWIALQLRSVSPGLRWVVSLALIAAGIAAIRWIEARVERLEATRAARPLAAEASATERRRAAP
jgi:UDP-GlcNAc:undecaprenyl-phosphate GlcNAc-1-phosphate transferase